MKKYGWLFALIASATMTSGYGNDPTDDLEEMPNAEEVSYADENAAMDDEVAVGEDEVASEEQEQLDDQVAALDDLEDQDSE